MRPGFCTMHDSQVLCGRGWHMAIEAQPEPITIDTAQTAVIVVDMQNDFCSKVDCLTGQESTSRRSKKQSGRHGECCQPRARPGSKLFI